MAEDAAGGGRLLVVDDEAHQREMLAGILERSGYEVRTTGDGERALEALAAESFDLVLTDQRMPVMDGIRLLDEIHARHPLLPVVLMTAYGSVSSAVQAIKRGAADYLTKPFERDELLVVLEKVLRHRRLEDEVVALRGALKDRYRLGNIIGSSESMQEVFALIERLAGTDIPVLVQGESGTGKELVARAIHEAGPREDGPFIALNCAAVPETLMESEFFGHERGAFTGAVRAHAGMFEQADGGTLFLDEIGAMRFELQAKLLRIIQDGQVQRLGSTSRRKVDVRILAATCEDLEESIRQRTFREDLYYRLAVVPIVLPALRDRGDDIPLLVDHFLSLSARKFGKDRLDPSPELLDRLQVYRWPGNVRELENCVERMVLLTRTERLGVDDLPDRVRRDPEPATGSNEAFRLPAEGVCLEDMEIDLIRQALARSRGSLGPAARLLGISYKTLQYRIRKHGLDREAFSPDAGTPHSR